MKSFRIHASEPSVVGRIPYLTLGVVGRDRISLDLGPMETDPARFMPSMALSLTALYDVLRGTPCVISRTSSTTTLYSEGDELVIEHHDYRKPQKREYRVWLSEVALAWNMLGQFGSWEHISA